MCLAQGPQRIEAGAARTRGPSSRGKHSTIDPLHSLIKYNVGLKSLLQQVISEPVFNLCVLIDILTKGEAGATLNRFKPLVKYFTVRSKEVLLLWIFYVFLSFSVCYAFVRVCLYVPCGHLLGKG